MPRRAEAYRLHHEVHYVGRMIKAAKRRVEWHFAFAGDTDEHAVVLVHTVNSGKKVIFLNGNQIFEEEKLSMSAWSHSFQLEEHLLSLKIESQLSDEGMYDLSVDGRLWGEMKHTTMADLRARNVGRVDESAAAWGRGGAVAGIPSDAPSASSGWEAAEAEYVDDTPPVQATSLKAFIGEGSGAASARGARGTPRGSAAAAAGSASGAWDPFSGGAAPAPVAAEDAFEFTSDPAPQQHSSRAPAPAPAAPSQGLRPPPGGAAHRHTAAPTPTPTPAPTPAPVSSLADDLAGLGFGSTPPRPTHHAPAAVHDPFAPAALASVAPVMTADLFSSPATVAAAPPAAATGTGDALYDSNKDLFDLDHLTAPKGGVAAPVVRPSLAQMAASKPATGTAPVMMGGTPSGLGASPLDMYVAPVGAGRGGMMPPAMGYGMPPHMMMTQQQQQPFGGMYGAAAPAPPPNPAAADYNPFA